MLAAVPAQLTPLDARTAAFARAVRDAITELTVDEATALITRLHTADTAALHAHIAGAERSASEAAGNERRHWDMLMQVQHGVSQKTFQQAAQNAEIGTLREVFAGIGQLVHAARNGTVETGRVAALLALQPLEPVHTATVAAFVPSEQYRGGQFRSTDDAVTYVFTFIGWALVDHGPGALGALEPMFLVSDRAMPRSAVEAERHVKMEALLPNTDPVRS
jgi:hypothetical protein